MLGARRIRAEQDTLVHHSKKKPLSRGERSVKMDKKRNKTSRLKPAALVLLGWICFGIGQFFPELPDALILSSLVVARVLPQAL